jgi:type IV secretory pathway VirD2 relaxase
VAGTPGTIVKARYSRGLKAARQLAKGHIRYAVHRCNEQGQRQYREVWDRDGAVGKRGAYERIDRIHQDDYVYRLTLSPHPEHQDASRQLDLQAWTRQVMSQLEQDPGQRVEWFAVSHEHPDHRHVHVVAVSPRWLDVGQLRAMRDAGDRDALAQRERAHERECSAAEARRGQQRDPGPDRDLVRPRGTHAVDRRAAGPSHSALLPEP